MATVTVNDEGWTFTRIVHTFTLEVDADEARHLYGLLRSTASESDVCLALGQALRRAGEMREEE